MKTIVKLGLIGLTLAASSAYADVALPDSGNGELTLFVRNDTTGAVYARGLQITLNDVLSQTTINGAYQGDVSTGLTQQIGYNIGTKTADTALSGFLNGTDSFSWTIVAGDSVGGATPTPDARRYLTTTQVGYGEDLPSEVNNTALVTFSQIQAVLNNVNGNIAGTTVGDGGSTAEHGQWRETGAVPGAIAGTWFGAGPNNVNALGTAAHLFVFTSGGGGNLGLARVYQGLDVVLNSNGTLSAVGVPSVPLPAAVWMLASGLVTLAGVGRRRKDQASAPVAA